MMQYSGYASFSFSVSFSDFSILKYTTKLLARTRQTLGMLAIVRMTVMHQSNKTRTKTSEFLKKIHTVTYSSQNFGNRKMLISANSKLVF